MILFPSVLNPKPTIFEKNQNMKKFYTIFAFCFVFSISCKTDKKATPTEAPVEMSILEKIAGANGFENWTKVGTLKFTFNVDRDTTHFERNWIWNVRENTVTGISLGDTVTYNRKAVDSTVTRVDAAFVNDKYWLLAPYQLVWDQNNFSFTHEDSIAAPISNTTMHKLTIVYGDDGGYTPGDAYDFYYGDDYIIKEWVFRKGNSPEPSSVTTWEGYKNVAGLNLSTMHTNADKTFALSFTNLEVNP